LQSVGRGVRIEPQKNKRKRILNLYNAKEIKEELFNKVRHNILPLESLFVFGTNAENLKEIIKALKEEKQEKDLGQEFFINKDAEKRLLLIPIYKESDKIFAEEKKPQKYGISADDFNLAQAMFNYLGKKVSLVKYEQDVKVIEKIEESFKDSEKDKYFDTTESRSIEEPDLLIDRILSYFSVRDREFDKFKKLENEIVHFKRIHFLRNERFEQLLNQIKEVKMIPEKEYNLKKAFDSHQLTFDDMLKQAQALKENQNFECDGKKIKIKYIHNHYYVPVILSEDEKINYLNHIIDIRSEVRFLEQLEQNILTNNNIFKCFDWWMFSKLDQTTDDVYIPYYNPRENVISKFKPDFIFWMQKDNEYTILFIDPKGTEHTDGFRKIDGYSRIFEESNRNHTKIFPFNGFNVRTKLLLMPAHGGIAAIPEPQRKYWFDNLNAIHL
jgi:hypothetical protein